MFQLKYLYNEYDTFEPILCDEEAIKATFGVDESADLANFVVTTCSMRMIMETDFVQEMSSTIDTSALLTEIEEVSYRPFDCPVFYAEVEKFVHDVISVSGNISRMLEDEIFFEQYIGDVIAFLGFLNELDSEEIEGMTSIISILEQFTSDDMNTDLLKLIIELFEYGTQGQFNSTEVLIRLADILHNSTAVSDWLTETTDLSPETIDQIMNLFLNADKLTYLDDSSDIDIYHLICNESTFDDLFTSEEMSLELVYAVICSPTDPKIIQYIYEAIDILKLIEHMKNQTKQLDDSSMKEDMMELYELFMGVSDESFRELLGISDDFKNGIMSVYDLVAVLSTGSEFSDIFRSIGNVLDEFEPILGENELYKEIAMLMDALENLGFIRNLIGELPTFKLGNMFYDTEEVEMFLITELGLSEKSAEDLLDSFVLLENILDLEYFDSFASVFCDEEQLDKLLTFPNNTSTSDIADALCHAEPEELVKLGDFLFKQLDAGEIVIDIVKFSISDQLENATESVKKVNNLINQLQDALPSLKSTMNISNILPDNILEDLSGTVSAQTANEALQVFVCGTTVQDAGDMTRRRRRETRSQKREVPVSATHMEFSGANVKSKREAESTGRQKRELIGGNYQSDAKTPFCNDLYRYINNGKDGVIAWTYLKPVLLGKIPYSPNSPAAQKIVKEANYMFDEIKQIRDFSEAWLAGSADLGSLNTNEFDNLVDLLDNTFVQNLLTQQTDIDADSLNSVLTDGIGLTAKDIKDINVLAEFIVNFTNCIEVDRFVGYDTEADMYAAAETLYDDNKLFAAVRFLNIDDATEVPHHVSYKIRVEIDNTPDTDLVTEQLWRPGPNNDFKTDQQYLRAFIIVQDMLDRGIINLHSSDGNVIQPTTYIQQMPYPCYQDDEFAYYITYAIPLFLTIAFIVVVAVMSYGQVYEKENGLEETMMIMGLKSKINWISWFFVNLLILTILAITIAVILKYGDILSRSDVFVIFVFLECFVFSIMMMSYMVGSVCQRPNIAALTGALIYSISFIPVFLLYLMGSELDLWAEILLCLLSPSAFCYGCEMLTIFEEQVIGATWSNFDTNPVKGEEISFGLVCAIMAADGILYFIIGWYAKNVFPGNYGIGKPWYFPLMPSYWCGCSGDGEGVGANTKKKYKSKKQPIESGTKLVSMLTGFYSPTSGDAYIGDYNIKTDAHVIRQDLGFCPQHNALYDNLTVREHLHMYGTLKGVSESRIQDEIDLMLETLEMKDMIDQLAKNLSGGMKRKLSVAIAFFAGSKVVILDEPTSGIDPNARRAIWDLIVQYKEGRTIILCTHFMDEADILGDRIAFLDHGRVKCCGSPMFLKQKYGSGYKLTLVKENASQMSTPSTTRVAHTDLSSSSQRSDSITTEENRQKEADRLENEYVIHPSIDDKQSTSHHSESSSARLSPRTNLCDTNSVTEFIKSYVEGAKLSEDIGSELSYNLPTESGQTQKFETFFNVLDSELENLHLTSYGISNTSLEEVFFKICGTGDDESTPVAKSEKKKSSNSPPQSADNGEDNWMFNHEYSGNNDIWFRASNSATSTSTNSLEVDDSIRITGLILVIHQFEAIIYKRFHSVRRDIRGFFWTIIFPSALIALALLIKEIRPTPSFPSRQLDPAMFGPSSYLFFSNGDRDDYFVEQMTDNLVYNPGIGTSCMADSNDKSEYPCIDSQDKVQLASELSYSEKVKRWEQDRQAPSCSCGDGYLICPEGAGGADPLYWRTNTTTILQDLSIKMDINEYLLRTSGDFTEKRYIGVTFDDIKRTSNGTQHVTRAWYDNNGLHALPTSLNVLNNIILRANFPRDTAPTYGNYIIFRYLVPVAYVKYLEAGINYGISILLVCAFSMIPAAFVVYLVGENLNGTKRQHYVSGMPKMLYIISNIVWDLITFLVPVGITLLIVYLFDAESFASPDNMPAFATLLLLYGWAVIPVMYISIRAFKDVGTAFITLFCVNIFIAMLTNLPVIIRELFPDAEHEDIYETINYCSLVFPQYCLAGGLTNLIYNQFEADMYARFGIDMYENPFSKEMLQWNFIALAVEGAFFLIVAILIEYILACNCNCSSRCLIKETDLSGEDDDVRQERQRVLEGGANDAMVKVKNLKKIYRAGGNRIVAVDSICVGIQKGECFGLLGVNGAGKTTTFKMMTGDAEPTTGSVSIDHNSRIGYCPQKDAVCDLTTGHELLVCYGMIKGLSIKQIKKIIPFVTGKLGMDKYINKRISTYSGGMKRSLSTAISLIGDPNILFLDEPTTGMDPISRRRVWKMINSVVKAGKSVILTSHSMEECEALCTRLAIMVNGRFKCIGSPQHVKSRFGDNFTIILRGADEQAVRQITTFFGQNYPTAVLKECHLNLVQYELPMKSTSLADIFGNIERQKIALRIEDYSVTQTSFEQKLRSIMNIKWEDFVVNLEVLERAKTNSIEATIIKHRLR
ncbi:phospholipid-transporting ATPase ABCA1-like [Anneissia japonica]|uniref:phospholipid-transporting ATPase ABCA1-like n=1 Tax=Anneissia japonica TaxID=1529436 RepID=UPI001425959C|nr:phospholipid-transporting ATPase ABCA1-like [Anneissia japonica]